MHMFYQMLKLDRDFKGLYTREEIGWTLIAGLAHDIGHQGTNNLFEIKMGTELARIAEKESVLEKMHIRNFFSLLKNKNMTILDKTKHPQQMKEMMTRAILATDVAQHFKNLEKFKALHNGG